MLALGAVMVLLPSCTATPPVSGPARSGPARAFDFDILQWKCRHASVVSAEETIEAEGEFCLVALNVTNGGEAPASLDPSCQFLIDTQRVRYTPDPEAMALDAAAVAAFGEEIAGGELIENSALYYDVPKGTHPDALELHETCEAPGLRLGLTPVLEGTEN